MIRILYVNGGLMNRGGIESYMMNYYRHFDRSKVQIDFIVHNAGGFGYYDEEIKSMGGKIFVLPKKSTHPYTYVRCLKKILKEGNYKIIHTHMDAMGAWVLKVAKRCGIPVRIAHSHNTQHLTTNPLKVYFLEKARKAINDYATHRMACSEVAGKWLFGEKDFTVVRNAIEPSKYSFNDSERKSIRSQYGITENNFLIGHIGRFDTQKNHTFLINVFAKVAEINPNCILMLVGEGRLMQELKDVVSKQHLSDKVIFTGVRDDAYTYYNAFDLFVLPSLFEGLPVVSIEAQMNGCISFFADTITKECSLSSSTMFIPLNIKSWKEMIIKKVANRGLHKCDFNIEKSGYDISTEAKKLENFYIDLWNKN